MGIQRGDPDAWPRGVSASRLDSPRSSRGASLTRVCERALFDVDLRYIDYANTPLFGTSVADGGLGWQSVFAVAFGVQYKATDRLSLLGGYLYNTDPIKNEATLFNVQAPGIITNTLSIGASFNVTEDITASLSWVHGFRNSITGPILQLPGASARLDAQVDTLWMGFNVRFGRKKTHAPAGGQGDWIYDGPSPSTSAPLYYGVATPMPDEVTSAGPAVGASAYPDAQPPAQTASPPGENSNVPESIANQ